MDRINRVTQSTEFQVRVSPDDIEGVQDNVDEALELSQQNAMDLADEVAASTTAGGE